MPRLFFVTTLCFLTALLHAQNITAAWGPAIPRPSKEFKFDIVYADENFSYIFFPGANLMGNNHFVASKLSKFDKNGKEIFTKELDLGDKRTSAVDLIPIRDKFIIFKKIEDRKNSTGELSYDFVDFDGNLMSKGKVISQATYSRKMLFTQVKVYQSKDLTKITLFIYDYNPSGTVKLLTFDNQMNQLYSPEVSAYDYPDIFLKKNQVALSNQGELYFLKNGETLNVYSTRPTKEYSISKGGKFLSLGALGLNENGEAIVGGYYAGEKTGDLQGTFTVKINSASNASVLPVYKPFDEKTRKLLGSYKEEYGFGNSAGEKVKDAFKSAYRNEAGVNNLESTGKLLSSVDIISAKNFYYMAVELNFETERMVTATNGSMSHEKGFHHEENLVTVIDQNGEIKASIIVPKHQLTWGNDTKTGACYFTDGQFFYLLFNDLDENLTGPGSIKMETYAAWKKSVAMIVKIDNLGNQTPKILYKVKDVDAVTEPKTFKQFDTKMACVLGFPVKFIDPAFNGTPSDYNLGKIKIE